MQGELVLGKYLVSRHIGGGGMAQVYLADIQGLSGQSAAIKIMNTEHVGKQRSQERFRREGTLMCKLAHPNLVHGYELGSHNGRPVIAMEYINGPSIEELIRKRDHLSAEESLKLILDVAQGLDHLFVRGEVQAHRDIKPANILVDTASGTAKITDFGISKAYEEYESLTLTSSFLGSPNYMSPEQIMDPRAADIRSDLYALGAVLFEMLTGQKAYPGNSTKEILDAHFDLASPSVVGVGEKTDLCNKILARTLADDPAARYQSPRELIEELAPQLGKSVRVEVPRYSKSTRTLVLVGAGLVLVTGAITAFALSGSTDQEPQQPASTGIDQPSNGAPDAGTPDEGVNAPAEPSGSTKSGPPAAKVNTSGGGGVAAPRVPSGQSAEDKAREILGE